MQRRRIAMAPARDFAIHSASFDWVFVVDADEIVPDALRDYLYERISDPGFDAALAVPRKNMFLGKPATASPDYQLRFFSQGQDSVAVHNTLAS